jgi:hypothetical protein
VITFAVVRDDDRDRYGATVLGPRITALCRGARPLSTGLLRAVVSEASTRDLAASADAPLDLATERRPITAALIDESEDGRVHREI